MVKIEIKMRAQSPKKHFLNASNILKYLIQDDKEMNDLIIFNPDKKNVVTTDKEVYEAIGSITQYDTFKTSKLTKFFEMVDVYPYRMSARLNKPILTFEKIEQLRKNVIIKQ